jgi:RNA polymerase sigma-70 factor (ECF subfamily)
VVGVLQIEIADGAVLAIHSVSNPDKIGHVAEVSGIALVPEK